MGHSNRCSTALATINSEGSTMLPAPRTMAARTLVSQITTAPLKITPE
jgi:hypothetical protein